MSTPILIVPTPGASEPLHPPPALRLLLDSITTTARVVSINAELQKRTSPVEDALHDALREVERRLANGIREQS